MDAYVRREPHDRELRRRQLAQRLVAHHARTQTIFRLTGLSRHQLATLRRRWRVTSEMRHRGPPPASFATFLSTQRMRDETAALAVFWRIFGNVSSAQGSDSQGDMVELGECMCEVLEAYVACFPTWSLELESLVLLAKGIEEADSIALGKCGSCRAVILVDLVGACRYLCSHCQRPDAPSVMSGESLVDAGEPQPLEHGETMQQELF